MPQRPVRAIRKTGDRPPFLLYGKRGLSPIYYLLDTGYTPYEGRDLIGWPVVVISRGEVIVEDGKLHAERGRGEFLACERADAFTPLGRQVPEMAQLDAWGTPLKL